MTTQLPLFPSVRDSLERAALGWCSYADCETKPVTTVSYPARGNKAGYSYLLCEKHSRMWAAG